MHLVSVARWEDEGLGSPWIRSQGETLIFPFPSQPLHSCPTGRTSAWNPDRFLRSQGDEWGEGEFYVAPACSFGAKEKVEK